MELLTFDRLQDNLKRLKRFKAVEILDDVATLNQANGGSYPSFPVQLLEEQVAAKDKRRVDTAMMIVGLLMAMTIEEYDFTSHPHLGKQSVMELFDLTFLSWQETVIFLEPPGGGKTHLAIALAIKDCYHGF